MEKPKLSKLNENAVMAGNPAPPVVSVTAAFATPAYPSRPTGTPVWLSDRARRPRFQVPLIPPGQEVN